MSLHFLAHPWEVSDQEDGILVTCSHRDLDAIMVPVLVDELFELVLENGCANLDLDFAQVQCVASIIIGKLLALNARLQQIGGRLILRNVEPTVYASFQAANVTCVLEIHQQEYQPV